MDALYRGRTSNPAGPPLLPPISILWDKMSQSPSGGWQQPPLVVQEGRLPTATTYFKKHKISKGETVAQSLKERFDYG